MVCDVKTAYKTAIKTLIDLSDYQKTDEKYLRDLEIVVRQQLGEDFAHKLDEKVKTFLEITHRLVSQETPGELGGDNNADMMVFYSMAIKPLQERVAWNSGVCGGNPMSK